MPGYQTKQESIAIGGVDNLIIRSLLDNQQFADPMGLAALVGISAATWPLFGLLWPSGAELAARMAQHPVTPGERILEIGCGLGLASLVGHRRGADMTASDAHPLAALFLSENLLLNGLPPMKYRHGLWGTVDGEVVDVNPTAPHERDVPHAPHAVANDGSANVLGRFDLIVGSDVLYERDDSGGLAHFIEDHAAPLASVWIVDPHRGNRPAFNRRMAHLGFALTEERLDRLATPLHTAYRGRMLTYCRSESGPTPGRG
jgi:predicted nicotinamide N-methyase